MSIIFKIQNGFEKEKYTFTEDPKIAASASIQGCVVTHSEVNWTRTIPTWKLNTPDSKPKDDGRLPKIGE